MNGQKMRTQGCSSRMGDLEASGVQSDMNLEEVVWVVGTGVYPFYLVCFDSFQLTVQLSLSDGVSSNAREMQKRRSAVATTTLTPTTTDIAPVNLTLSYLHSLMTHTPSLPRPHTSSASMQPTRGPISRARSNNPIAGIIYLLGPMSQWPHNRHRTRMVFCLLRNPRQCTSSPVLRMCIWRLALLVDTTPLCPFSTLNRFTPALL